uniref:MULE domain-containing protein n=1 Tax=Caenorhabditis tropicalis TaxID=1561998 RepID=A0A1I7T2L1_9PELO
MEAIALNQDEIDVIAALETCIFYKELLAQHLGKIPPMLPMTLEREAVVAALINYTAVLQHLPGMFTYVGYAFDHDKTNVFETLDYAAGDRAARKVRVLDPAMLFQYTAFARTIGKQIDADKVWHIFVCRHYHHSSVQTAMMIQHAARQQAFIEAHKQQQLLQQKLFEAEIRKQLRVPSERKRN